MAARLPLNQLPFDSDTETFEFELPDGSQYHGTKRMQFDKLMALSYSITAQVVPLIKQEQACRVEIMSLLYPDGYPTNAETGRMDGTDKFELPSGWVLEFEKRVGCKIDEAQLPAIREAISKLPPDEETGEVPDIGNAIRYRPELSDSAYGLMDPRARVILNEALTFTPGTPGVKAVAPKPKAAVKPSDQKAVAK